MPGTKASSVISDDYAGALDLTNGLLSSCRAAHPTSLFIGGRANDHNTSERIRGFRDACRMRGIPERDMPCLAAMPPKRPASVLKGGLKSNTRAPVILFINATISLEGILPQIEAARIDQTQALIAGCFDCDPFAARVGPNLRMVKQDVARMLDAFFERIAAPGKSVRLVQGSTIVQPPQ